MPDNFHGYIPGRGTGTAWKSILKDVINKKNIYEIDFKQFFPSIPSDKLAFFLDELGLPWDVNYWFYASNQSLPLFLESPSRDKIPGEVRWTPSHQDLLVKDYEKIK